MQTEIQMTPKSLGQMLTAIQPVSEQFMLKHKKVYATIIF
jgi:hypothetical protein